MSENILLPCPFCGTDVDGPYIQEYSGDTYSPVFWIECPNGACSAFMELPAPEEFVITAWNNRR